MNAVLKTSTLAIGLLVALGLSGCTDSKPEPAPAPSTPAAPTPTAARAQPPASEPVPQAPGPGPAHVGNYTYRSDSNIPQATFGVNASWSKLSFGVQMYKSAQCGILQAEPPAGTGTGPQPQITFTSPSGLKTKIPLGTYSSCDASTHNKVGTAPDVASMASEQGTWKVDVNGRGVNVYLRVAVMGS